MSDSENKASENYSCAVGFPHRPGDVVLRDGSTVQVRPVRPGDAAELEVFLAELSSGSLYRRFFSMAIDLADKYRDQLRAMLY